MSDEEEQAFVTLLNTTGADDLQGVLQVLSEERLGMAQLHDENNALRIYNRRLRLVVNYALQVFELCGGIWFCF